MYRQFESQNSTSKRSRAAPRSPVELIQREIPHLRRFARTLTRNQDSADDLVHDCLVRAVEKIDQWQSGTNMRAWLMVILRNIFYNHCRRNKREQLAAVELANAPGKVALPRQEDHHELREVGAAYETLSDAHREVLSLVVIHGMDYETTANVLDVEIGTVKSRLSRARHELRKKVDGECEWRLAA